MSNKRLNTSAHTDLRKHPNTKAKKPHKTTNNINDIFSHETYHFHSIMFFLQTYFNIFNKPSYFRFTITCYDILQIIIFQDCLITMLRYHFVVYYNIILPFSILKIIKSYAFLALKLEHVIISN